MRLSDGTFVEDGEHNLWWRPPQSKEPVLGTMTVDGESAWLSYRGSDYPDAQWRQIQLRLELLRRVSERHFETSQDLSAIPKDGKPGSKKKAPK